MVGFHYVCFVYNSDEKLWFQLQVAGPAQGLGLRPHPKKQKKKIHLGKKAPLSRVKSPNFYKIIYIYIFKGYAFFLLVVLRILQILLLAYKLPCY